MQIGFAGPPGVGKTTGAALAAYALGQPYVGKIQGHAELSPAEIMGYTLPYEGGYRWEPGPADLAYSKGGTLILDEIHEFSGPCKTYLLGLLDRGAGGTISYVGRTFKQEPGYQVVATMNGSPTSGVLPEALLDRFDAWFYILAPSEEQLMLLEPDLRVLCRVGYESATDPLRGPDITFRMYMGFQRLRKHIPQDVALLGACYNDKQLAHSMSEVLALLSPEDYEDEPPALPDPLVQQLGSPVAPEPEKSRTKRARSSTTARAASAQVRERIPVLAPKPEPVFVTTDDSDDGDDGDDGDDEDIQETPVNQYAEEEFFDDED